MGVYAGPEITSDGLVLALDAGNLKGFDDDENLLTNSNISSTTWNPNSSPVLTNNSSTSPDGSVNATQIAASAAAGSGIFRTISLTLGTVYTYSVFVKAVSGSNTIYFGTDTGTDSRITVNTSTGVASLNFGSPTNITSVSYPNSWYRVSFTFTASATATHSFVIYNLTASANTWLAWGAQLETGSSASPYYPTTGTIKNRGTTWTDLTGNGNTGTLTNGPTYSSANGGSLVFDGSNDFIDFTSDSNLLPTAGLTVSVWFKTTSNTGFLVNKTSTGSNGYGLFLDIAGVVYFRVGSFSLIGWSVNTGAWFNIVGTWTPSTSMTLYRNGTLSFTSTSSIPASITDPSFTLEIGRSFAGTYYFNGNIAQVQIYNRALTAAEIQQNFNATRGRFGI